MAGLTLLMPVSYRAGTDTAHAHTVFQLWIDAATGRSHHHDGGDDQSRVADTTHQAHGLVGGTTANDTAHALGLPHLHTADGSAVILGDTPISQQPDHAEPVTTSMPVQHANALGALATLIVLLLVDADRRSLWFGARRLIGVMHLPEPPPPRIAPC